MLQLRTLLTDPVVNNKSFSYEDVKNSLQKNLDKNMYTFTGIAWKPDYWMISNATLQDKTKT
jgi:hypothetical protein